MLRYDYAVPIRDDAVRQYEVAVELSVEIESELDEAIGYPPEKQYA